MLLFLCSEVHSNVRIRDTENSGEFFSWILFSCSPLFCVLNCHAFKGVNTMRLFTCNLKDLSPQRKAPFLSYRKRKRCKTVTLDVFIFSTLQETGIRIAWCNIVCSHQSGLGLYKYVLGAGTDIFLWEWSSLDAQKVMFICLSLCILLS